METIKIMADNKIFCNITECFFNQLLDEVHQKEGRPGFTPLPGTGLFKGMCTREAGIDVEYHAYMSITNLKQQVPECASYSEEPVEPAEETMRVECSYRDCLFNTAAHPGDIGRCKKFHDDEKNLYVDWVTVFDGNETKQVSRCESASRRTFEGHIDFAKAALGNRGANMKTMPTSKDFGRPSIRGSW